MEWINGPIIATVVKDEEVDMETGTGVMTITPWHDKTDFEIAKRHSLSFEQVIDEQGRLLPIAEEFAGTKILEARPKIIQKIKQKGLLVKTDERHTHSVQVCYKCNSLIEPQVREQWFVKMEPLARPAIEAIENGKINMLTNQHKKIALHWLRNIEDWNISRQIVWGIPIPAWFKDGEAHIGGESPGQGWVKDPDTFDTWFSSSQWPYITLGYPDSSDFKTFYPTTVMESGADLIFFWISRMVMLGLYRTDEIPFKYVYLHGLVRDAKGEKMSKSKGNVISPLEVSDEFGTDALRMGLVVGNTQGTDLNLDPRKIGAYKKFANKIWNIARFVLSQERAGEIKSEFKEEFDALAKDITEDIEQFRIHLAAEKLYHYVWDRFAAQIIEESKGKPEYGETLHYILENSLKLLHPFMPFVTEEIWSAMPNRKDLLMVEQWPRP